MKSISSKEAQNHFGELMNQAVKSPVIINKYGKPTVVLISHEEYEKFNQLEDMYWAMQAKNVSKSGFLSEEESKDFLNKILKE
ncbi:prevent-host-death family protein [Rickettsia endosymbiont of Ixodes pacificus]|uniref:type II toxin-antitoxin system Phd/YefM family antitoxin n=1 Tax=Rickettsia endosymbiont of Ixodes pacificus TaxID=1133329 RepID=UPI00061FE055|nr:type II toxin-antitoxin system Phd/YefM family antitoxin [Rickettsia endosymbiont of Ixodes pacificus]KJW02377.1 prevent-host-death family protein [Rickettsia endosymbiont of Ixodes pacificus]